MFNKHLKFLVFTSRLKLTTRITRHVFKNSIRIKTSKTDCCWGDRAWFCYSYHCGTGLDHSVAWAAVVFSPGVLIKLWEVEAKARWNLLKCLPLLPFFPAWNRPLGTSAGKFVSSLEIIWSVKNETVEIIYI